VVTSQDSDAIHRALEATGMYLGKHLILTDRDKPYVNADLFESDIRTMFLPHLLSTRLIQNLREEDAVLWMDNCSPHLSPVVFDLRSTSRVRLVTFTSHTTEIVSVLDMALFGIFKRRAQYQLPFDDDIGSPRFINKVYHDFRWTMTDTTRWRAFRDIGILEGIVAGMQRVSFSERTLRERKGFRELWDMDFPLENLSVRHRTTPFEWMNRPE
jgi:hypothetical protein